MDEWASNLRRGVELKEDLSHDLVEYLEESSNDEEKSLIRMGAYPEINSLLGHSYSEGIGFLEIK